MTAARASLLRLARGTARLLWFGRGTARFIAVVTRAVLIGALALVGAGASAGCADQDDALHGAVHGTVRDAASGKGLKGVAVTFVSDTLEEADDATDAEGRFVINVAASTPSGRLTASKTGYESSTVSVFLDDGDVKIDIELERK